MDCMFVINYKLFDVINASATQWKIQCHAFDVIIFDVCKYREHKHKQIYKIRIFFKDETYKVYIL